MGIFLVCIVGDGHVWDSPRGLVCAGQSDFCGAETVHTLWEITNDLHELIIPLYGRATHDWVFFMTYGEINAYPFRRS